MTQYRKKPVVIDAVRWAGEANDVLDTGYAFDVPALPPWLLAALESGELAIREDGTVAVVTLEDGKHGEAKHIASPGDWIIRGVQGELYPCKPDIFAATYVPVFPPCSADEALV